MADVGDLDPFSPIRKALASNADLSSVEPVSEGINLLETFLKQVWRTGTPHGFSWDQVKAVILAKFDQVTRSYEAEKPISSLPPVLNVDNYTFQEYRDRIVQYLDRFDDSPFTIGRLCELLLEPKKHYDRGDKFLRAFEKCVSVTSTTGSTDMEMNGLDATKEVESAKPNSEASSHQDASPAKMETDASQNGHGTSASHDSANEGSGGKGDNSVSSSVDEKSPTNSPSKEQKADNGSVKPKDVGATEGEKEDSHAKSESKKDSKDGDVRADQPKRSLDEPDALAKKIARLENGGVNGANPTVDFGEPDVEPRAEKNGQHEEKGAGDAKDLQAKADGGKDAAAIDQDVVGHGTAV